MGTHPGVPYMYPGTQIYIFTNIDFLFYIYVFCYCYKQFTELYSCLAVVALFAAAFIVAACAGEIV